MLADAPPGDLARVLDRGGIPNVSSRTALAEAPAEAARRGGLSVRVGVHGDGFPKALADGADILSVGMQFTARVEHDGTDPRVLVGASDDVDEFAAQAGMTSHELVVGLAWR